ncbi:MAG: hypothetical protein Q7U73_04975 [Rubrivivax sp.]|nr:hypothetical protein [Rubrivivax sp.]
MHTQDTAAPEAPPVTPGAGARAIVWQSYQAERPEWFRTPEAFQWFKRQHQAELTRAGALAVIAGRVFVVPDAFDAAVIAIGRRLAAARAA